MTSPATLAGTTFPFDRRTPSWSRRACRLAPSRSLINRTHTDRDLYLPIDAAEKRLLDAIDGNRSIGEIGRGLAGMTRRARSYFERLWWYDQIVVDASTGRVA